jgi:hypothetical protein
MPRTDVPQRELRGLTPHDITQHYASERVTAFQMEGHQLTTCLPIRWILEGHVVGPEGIRNSSLSYSQHEQYFPIQKWTLKVFLGINTDKDIGAPLAGPKPVPIPTSCYSFTGLPLLGSKEGRLLIFQRHQFLAGCATVDMKMQNSSHFHGDANSRHQQLQL